MAEPFWSFIAETYILISDHKFYFIVMRLMAGWCELSVYRLTTRRISKSGFKWDCIHVNAKTFWIWKVGTYVCMINFIWSENLQQHQRNLFSSNQTQAKRSSLVKRINHLKSNSYTSLPRVFVSLYNKHLNMNSSKCCTTLRVFSKSQSIYHINKKTPQQWWNEKNC